MFAILPVLVLLSVNYLASHVIGTVFPAARSENIDRVKADMVLDENIVTHHVWSNTAHSIADADHWVGSMIHVFNGKTSPAELEGEASPTASTDSSPPRRTRRTRNGSSISRS
eukprot:INCI18069.4.p2 GENE.INCI18069.4~~INCI18069.4.p2  ORF type:complete len:113 (-),score=15.63 INCI18069.4:113-451(-)